MSTRLATCSSLFLLALAAACQAPAPHAADWGYEGDTGPAHWGDLNPDYDLAKTGQQQSPINIVTANVTPVAAGPIEASYEGTSLEVLNNGHTIEVDYHSDGAITVDGHRYTLAQFHFHSPSEHTINGAHSAMEMHLVHKDADGNLAVVAVMIDEGQENGPLGLLEEHFPEEEGPAHKIDGVLVDATELLPANRASFRYSGSLTTPPCSEGVSWFVLQQPIEASAAQIESFREIYYGNNRPTQPLNGRAIVRVE